MQPWALGADEHPALTVQVVSAEWSHECRSDSTEEHFPRVGRQLSWEDANAAVLRDVNGDALDTMDRLEAFFGSPGAGARLEGLLQHAAAEGTPQCRRPAVPGLPQLRRDLGAAQRSPPQAPSERGDLAAPRGHRSQESPYSSRLSDEALSSALGILDVSAAVDEHIKELDHTQQVGHELLSRSPRLGLPRTVDDAPRLPQAGEQDLGEEAKLKYLRISHENQEDLEQYYGHPWVVDSLPSRLATQRTDALAALSIPERRRTRRPSDDRAFKSLFCGGPTPCFPECGSSRRPYDFIMSPDKVTPVGRSLSASTADPGSRAASDVELMASFRTSGTKCSRVPSPGLQLRTSGGRLQLEEGDRADFLAALGLPLGGFSFPKSPRWAEAAESEVQHSTKQSALPTRL